MKRIIIGVCSTGRSAWATPVQQYHTPDVVVTAGWIEDQSLLPWWHHFGRPGGNCCFWRCRNYEDRCRDRIITECIQVWAHCSKWRSDKWYFASILQSGRDWRCYSTRSASLSRSSTWQNVVRNSLKQPTDWVPLTLKTHWYFWGLHF